jgi:hypothetical protein
VIEPFVMLLPVDESLRYTLFGVSVILQIDLSAAEIERLFVASATGDSTARQYTFHCSPVATVTGTVDEHEPQSVRLAVKARGFDPMALARLVRAAQHASFGRRDRPDLS